MKTIFWDYNGTILDDVRLTYDIEQMMLTKRGMHTYTLAQYKDMFCFPVIDYYYKMGYTFEHETYDDISVEFHEAYEKGFDTCTLADGFLDVIEASVEHGYQNVIISAANKNKLIHQCEKLGIAKYFDKMFGTDDILGGSKIDLAKDYMVSSHTDPSMCMFIGDTLHDAETAEAMDVKDIILTSSGHQSRKVLEEGGYTVVDSLKEIHL